MLAPTEPPEKRARSTVPDIEVILDVREAESISFDATTNFGSTCTIVEVLVLMLPTAEAFDQRGELTDSSTHVPDYDIPLYSAA